MDGTVYRKVAAAVEGRVAPILPDFTLLTFPTSPTFQA